MGIPRRHLAGPGRSLFHKKNTHTQKSGAYNVDAELFTSCWASRAALFWARSFCSSFLRFACDSFPSLQKTAAAAPFSRWLVYGIVRPRVTFDGRCISLAAAKMLALQAHRRSYKHTPVRLKFRYLATAMRLKNRDNAKRRRRRLYMQSSMAKPGSSWRCSRFLKSGLVLQCQKTPRRTRTQELQ